MGVLRGLAGAEDFAFGFGTEQRMEGFAKKAVRTQIRAEHIPIADLLGDYDATNVEDALKEALDEAIQTLFDAADALYDAGYIDDKIGFIDDILDEAHDVAEDINDDEDDAYDGGTDTGDTSDPVTAGIMYIRYPALVRPLTNAILWVEGVGMAAPYTWSLLANNSVATLTPQSDTSRVLYTAGAVEGNDTIKVTDANGLTATCIIGVDSSAPVITIYGASAAVVDGPAIALHATGGATPYDWVLETDATGATLTDNSGYFVGQGSADYFPGSIPGTDTVQVTENGGSVDLHDIVVSSEDPASPNPQIHGASSVYVRGASDPDSAEVVTSEDYVALLQCVGGTGAINWEISDDNSGASIYPMVVAPSSSAVYGGAASPSRVAAAWRNDVPPTIAIRPPGWRSDPEGVLWQANTALIVIGPYTVVKHAALTAICALVDAEILAAPLATWISSAAYSWGLVTVHSTVGESTPDLIDALEVHYPTLLIEPNYRRFPTGSSSAQYLDGTVASSDDPESAVEIMALYVAGTTEGVTDTIKVTDVNQMTDEHTITVLAAAVITDPTIYGWTVCIEDGELILKVYGGTPPYNWEIVTDGSGCQLFEYENDEDGQNRYKAGSTGGTVDVLRVTDANGGTDEHSISVYEDDDAAHDDDGQYPWTPPWNDEKGFLRVNIAPEDAITDGAMWRANGGTWTASGQALEDFNVGDAVYVEFKTVDEWTIPAAQTVTIVAGANVASGTYLQAAGAIASFLVTCDRDYYPGRVLRLTITPKDALGATVYVAETSILIESDSEGLDLYSSGTCQRTDATISLATTIGGGGTYYKDVVWWGETAFSDPMTITVKLVSDATVTGAATVDLDAATLALTDTGAGAYINETKYEHLGVAVKDSAGATCAEFDGNVLLTPSEGTISTDGITYAASATVAITNGSASMDLYLAGCTGDVTITAVLVDDTTKTDTTVLTEVPITFVFGSAWDAANTTGLISDATGFEISVTAMQGGGIATTFAGACTITTDTGTPTGNTIAGVDWTAGVVTMAALSIDWAAAPTEIVLTCADDATGLKLGTRTVKTDNASEVTSENMTIKIARKYAQSGPEVSAEAAFNAASVIMGASASYGDTTFYADKVETHWGTTYGEYCRFDHAISLLHVALTTFGADEDLFLELVFANPAKAAAVWSQADLYIGESPTAVDYSGSSDEAQWTAGVDIDTMRLISEAVITNSGTLLIDLNMKRSDFTAGIPMQVFIRPAISTSIGSYVSDALKHTRYYPASAKLKGY